MLGRVESEESADSQLVPGPPGHGAVVQACSVLFLEAGALRQIPDVRCLHYGVELGPAQPWQLPSLWCYFLGIGEKQLLSAPFQPELSKKFCPRCCLISISDVCRPCGIAEVYGCGVEELHKYFSLKGLQLLVCCNAFLSNCG